MRGSIVKRGKTYGYVLYLGRDDQGRKRQKRVGGFRTKREAEAALTEALERKRTGTWGDPGRRTAGDLLRQWIEGVRPSLRETTAASYQAMIDGWLIPRTGTQRLAAIDAAYVSARYGDLISSCRRADRARSALRRVAAVRTDIQELRDRLQGIHLGAPSPAIAPPAPGISWGRAVPIAAAAALAAVLGAQVGPRVLGLMVAPREPGAGAVYPGWSGNDGPGSGTGPRTPLSMPSHSALGTASGGQGFGIDAAFPGSAQQDAALYRDGVRLIAGYLPSPGALNAWSAGDFIAAEQAGCVTLPIWVPTQDPSALTAAQGMQDGRQAVHAAKTIGHTGGGIGLDMEENISSASPDGTQAYTEAFARTVTQAGFAAVAYGSGQYISQLYAAPNHSYVAAGWVASWPGSLPSVLNTSQGTPAFPGSNIWQYAGTGTLDGIEIDPDVVSSGALNAIAGRPVTPAQPPAGTGGQIPGLPAP
jgi:Domain of unknown function (DUF1906)/Arm DNA-binding domain/Phage integrase, N-terminal SAM-like domain